MVDASVRRISRSGFTDPVTAIKTINAKGHTSVSTIDPGRGLTLTVTDLRRSADWYRELLSAQEHSYVDDNGLLAQVTLTEPTSRLQLCLVSHPEGSPEAFTELRPGLEVVAQISRSDDFEGYLEWIIGLNRGTRWRVTRLDAPVRLLVDVENKVQLSA